MEIPETVFGLKNGDKFVAVCIWFGNFAITRYFAGVAFGSALLPWNVGLPKDAEDSKVLM